MEALEHGIEVLTINDVRAYEKDGVAYLNLEDVARGLGFTKTDVKNGVSYETVRWQRVFDYLGEFGFDHKWAKDDYIPENIFYRLAMKAKNDVAERFQAKVADEIIPSIRKHGMYATRETTERMINDPDFAIRLLQEIKKERQERMIAESRLALAAPKVFVYDALVEKDQTLTMTDTAKMIGCGFSVVRLNNKLIEDGICYRSGKGRHEKGVVLPRQKYVDEGLFVIREGYDRKTGHPFIQTRVTFKGRDFLVKKYRKKYMEGVC